MTATFKHLSRTGLTETQVLAKAKDFRKRALKRGFDFTLQEAIDAVIDAHVEACQG